ncbi:MAG: ATP-binding cassette domain-containing protein, partial [Anaerorhabdus sp.]
MKTILKVENLKKTFTLSKKQMKIAKTKEKKKIAVNGISFEAYEGEIFGLLGPNGAGKTTTLRMISTLIKPDEGDAIVDGSSIVNNPGEVRGKIGFLTSELKLEDFFTPNYLFDFFSDLHGVNPQVRNKRKESLFKRF